MVARDLQGAIDLAARVLDDLGIREPPVPSSFIHFIDTARPVLVAVEPLGRLTRGATMLAPDDSEWRVVLNANDRVEVRRFTLAHEAFHIACGTGLAFRRDGCGEFYECSLADHFASHLLVPRAWLAQQDRLRAASLARRCLVTASVASVALRSDRVRGQAAENSGSRRAATALPMHPKQGAPPPSGVSLTSTGGMPWRARPRQPLALANYFEPAQTTPEP